MTDKRPRILIVDDDQAHLQSTRGILEEDRYEVFTHNNPLGTTNLVKELKPDLLLLDVNMPGLSGEKLSHIIKSHPRTEDTRIYFYSSNDEDQLRKAVVEHGVDGYICKGSPSGLRTKLRTIFRQHTASDRVEPRSQKS